MEAKAHDELGGEAKKTRKPNILPETLEVNLANELRDEADRLLQDNSNHEGLDEGRPKDIATALGAYADARAEVKTTLDAAFGTAAPAEKSSVSEAEALSSFWGDPIDVYTRAEALADGVLVDVSETARETGFSAPVALTASVWGDVGHQGEQDGRLWDLLWMARSRAAILAEGLAKRGHGGAPLESRFSLIMPIGRGKRYEAKLCLGSGDTGEPAITIMLPDES